MSQSTKKITQMINMELIEVFSHEERIVVDLIISPVKKEIEIINYLRTNATSELTIEQRKALVINTLFSKGKIELLKELMLAKSISLSDLLVTSKRSDTKAANSKEDTQNKYYQFQELKPLLSSLAEDATYTEILFEYLSVTKPTEPFIVADGSTNTANLHSAYLLRHPEDTMLLSICTYLGTHVNFKEHLLAYVRSLPQSQNSRLIGILYEALNDKTPADIQFSFSTRKYHSHPLNGLGICLYTARQSDAEKVAFSAIENFCGVIELTTLRAMLTGL